MKTNYYMGLRGSGKSYNAVQRASYLNIPIIIGTDNQYIAQKLVEQKAKELNVTPPTVYCLETLHLCQEDDVIIDEAMELLRGLLRKNGANIKNIEYVTITTND